MNLLAIETSSPVLSVACMKSNGVLSEAAMDGGLQHAENLIVLVKQVLDSAKLKKNEIDVILCGIGPGSFTGLRIGLAAVKGLALGLKKKVAMVSSLDAIQEGISISDGDLTVLLDARRGSLYAAQYAFKNGKAKKTFSDSLLPFDQLIKRIKPKSTLAGSGLAIYADAIQKKVKNVVLTQPRFWNPKAAALIPIFQREKKPQFVPLNKLKPAYLRLTEAEERKLIHARK